MRRLHWIPGLALAFALIAPGMVVLGLLGTKFGWLAWGVSEFLIHRAPTPLALLAISLGVIAGMMALMAKPRDGLIIPLIAVALGAAVYAVEAEKTAHEVRFPPVHDVSTNWTDPVMFSPALMAARGVDSTPVERAPVVPEAAKGGGLFAGRPIAEINARTCPAAVPLTLTVTSEKAFAIARAALNGHARHGTLSIFREDSASGVIEASVANVWNMKEDVAIRVRPEGAGARIDLRVVARHSVNDSGHACDLVTELRGRMQALQQ